MTNPANIEAASTADSASPAAFSEAVVGTPIVQTPARPPRFFGVVLAPWINILRPTRAAATLIAARGWAFAITLGAHLLLFAVALTFYVLPRSPASEQIFWIMLALATLATAVVAWLFLPDVHRTGPIWPSYARALRATTSGFALLVAVLWMLRAIFGVGEDEPRLAVRLHVEPAAIWFPVICVCLWLIVIWLSRAFRAAELNDADPELPPRCEGCGYDLTHQAADGRCTECGLAVDASLTPGRLRPGSSWIRRPSVKSWLRTTGAVVFRPSHFYRALQVRTPGPTERNFALWHYAAIVAGAATCLGGLMIVFVFFGAGPSPREFIPILITFSLAAGLGCWLGHRVIAAVVLSSWLMSRTLPDGRWAAKVIAYEAAFLWVFCCYWGLLAMSFMVFRNWISRSLVVGPHFALGLAAEQWVILAGTFALGAVWLWRYHIAHRAIRWNNF